MPRATPTVILIAWLAIASAGCQSTAPVVPDGAQRLLVTFDADPTAALIPPAGSARTYHGGYSGGSGRASPRVAQRVRQVRARYRLMQIDAWPIEALNVYCVLFVARDGTDLAQLLDDIAAVPGVDAAQPLGEFEGLASQRLLPPPVRPPHGAAAGIEALHAVSRGRAARIGMVDTLVDDDHPDLKGQVARQHEIVGTGGSKLHGTAVAGVLAANADNADGITGLAPDAQLHVFGGCRGEADGGARCNSFDLAKALQLAIDSRLDVLNLSLGGPHDPLLARLLGVALAQGVTVVAAANPRVPDRNFPASMAGVIAVDTLSAFRTAGFPARDLQRNWIIDPERLSTQAGGGHRFFHGNSMSAAGLSGIAALHRDVNGHDGNAVEHALRTTVVLRAVLNGDCPSLFRQAAAGDLLANTLVDTLGCRTGSIALHTEQR